MAESPQARLAGLNHTSLRTNSLGYSKPDVRSQE